MPGDSKKRSSLKNPTIGALRARVANAPHSPGVYRWLDRGGSVLYVGKATNLRNRLRSYLRGDTTKAAGPWRKHFLEQIADFELTVTTNELEALLLETNLIKELRPKFNVLMKDDKNYLFVRVAVQDAYPRVETVRRLTEDGAKYFGPYLSAEVLHRTLDTLHEAIGYRACRGSLDALNRGSHPKSPCLDFHIGRCCGLCAGVIDQAEYRCRIEQVIEFLQGSEGAVRELLRERMREAAAGRKFERAAKLRDLHRALEGKAESQVATDTTGEDADVIGVALLSGRASVVVLYRRLGRLIGEAHFSLRGQAESIASVLAQFLPQYYEEGREVPPAVIVSEDIEDRDALEQFLRERRGRKVELLVPKQGRKSRLLQLAEKNAAEKARQEELKWETERRNTVEALEGLQVLLGLPAPPRRIEGYDVSHLSGTETVGSMVVVINGKAANDQYRSFLIHSMREGEIDDYRALKEVLRRRLRHLSGGYAREVQQWKEEGITLGRVRKEEERAIRDVIARHPDELSGSDLAIKTFFVARQDDRVIGFVRLRTHEGKLQELGSLWVDERHRGRKLGHVLARAVLRTVKRGKVYVRALPELEQYYGEIGFRPVLKSPKIFEERWAMFKREHPIARERVVMVYDPLQHKPDASLQAAPDLLVVDGGKGQLSAALEVLEDQALTLPVIGLAKKEEEIYTPHRSKPLPVPKYSPALFLLMRLRDEAHRFANTLREKRGVTRAKRSVLDTIAGIGPQTKDQLLRRFRTIDGIRSAPPRELKEVLTEEQYRALRKVLS